MLRCEMQEQFMKYKSPFFGRGSDFSKMLACNLADFKVSSLSRFIPVRIISSPFLISTYSLTRSNKTKANHKTSSMQQGVTYLHILCTVVSLWKILFLTQCLQGSQVLWLQNIPQSSALLHRALQLV